MVYQQHVFTVVGFTGRTVQLKFTGTQTDAEEGTTDFVVDDTALNVS